MTNNNTKYQGGMFQHGIKKKTVNSKEPFIEGDFNPCPDGTCPGTISLIGVVHGKRKINVGVCLICGLEVKYRYIQLDHKRSKKGKGVRHRAGGNPTRVSNQLALRTFFVIKKKKKHKDDVDVDVTGDDFNPITI